jgi:hypothetical protein
MKIKWKNLNPTIGSAFKFLRKQRGASTFVTRGVYYYNQNKKNNTDSQLQEIVMNSQKCNANIFQNKIKIVLVPQIAGGLFQRDARQNFNRREEHLKTFLCLQAGLSTTRRAP